MQSRPEVKIEFDSSIPETLQQEVGTTTKTILKICGERSGNDKIMITSCRRTPEIQAEAMYTNLKNGRVIKYTSPGQQVTEVYNNMKKRGASKDKIIEAMVAKINSLITDNFIVSKHCVSITSYAELNVIDVTKNLSNLTKFIQELADQSNVSQVIAPFVMKSSIPKVKYDANEPAIHIEIIQ
jgi:hypothetical protein